MARRIPVKLASARAYWRLAAKSRRAGNWRMGDHWQSVAERLHRAYLRDREAQDTRDAKGWQRDDRTHHG